MARHGGEADRATAGVGRVVGYRVPGHSPSRSLIRPSPGLFIASVVTTLAIAACGSGTATTSVDPPTTAVTAVTDPVDTGDPTPTGTATTTAEATASTQPTIQADETAEKAPSTTAPDTTTTPAVSNTAVTGSATTTAGTIQPTTETTVADTTPTEDTTATSTTPTTTETTQAETTTATTEPPAATTTEAPIALEISDDVPDVDMFDAATGATVNLRSVVKGEKPLLFWFWSPF